MATTAHTAGDRSPGTRSTGRTVRMAIMGLLLAAILVQFYLAGRGTFRAGSFEPHEILGSVIHGVTLIALIVTLVFTDLRNRTDIALAVALFVLASLQFMLASYETPELAAFHPVNGLLIMGAVSGMLARDRRGG
ncbi:MAG: DUF6220 domain-containing protein [Actinomycetota bacterium]|nr:DUF6220 domain-containing protein [Actinomycetota bacterium]